MLFLVAGQYKFASTFLDNSPYLGRFANTNETWDKRPVSNMGQRWETYGLPWLDSKTWGLDNGGFTKEGVVEANIVRWLEHLKEFKPKRLKFFTVPDSVWPSDAAITRKLFDKWEPKLRRYDVPLAYATHEGQSFFKPPWGRMDVLFIGGE